ncbi:MAG: response regulator [Opitutales bacterium]|nr:response regulator [Opitutales bacterium]NRA27915.1 response regulator [Opitutales bacterium]
MRIGFIDPVPSQENAQFYLGARLACLEEGVDFAVHSDLSILNDQTVSGMILNNLAGDFENEARGFLGPSFPMVCISRKETIASRVFWDYKRALKEALQHLVELGHRNIVFICYAAEREPFYKERIEAFKAVVSTHFEDVLVPFYILEADDPEDARKRIGEVILENPEISAIVSGINHLGLSLRTAVELQGKRIPRDVAVIDFDNLSRALSEYGHGRFSAVCPPYYCMGYQAAKIVIAKTRNRREPRVREIIDSDFVIRGTTDANRQGEYSVFPEDLPEEAPGIYELARFFFSSDVISVEVALQLARELLATTQKKKRFRRAFFETTFKAVSLGLSPFFAHAQAIQMENVARTIGRDVELVVRIKEVFEAVRRAQVDYGFTAERYATFERQKLTEARERSQHKSEDQPTILVFLTALLRGVSHLGASVQSVMLFDHTILDADGQPEVQVWRLNDEEAWSKYVPEDNILAIDELLPGWEKNSASYLVDMKSSEGVMCTVSIDFDCVTPQIVADFLESLEPILQQSLFAKNLERTARALEQEKSEAREAMASKNEFLTNVSHEIRTPMNGIIGIADLLLETELSAQQREYLSMIRDSGTALLSVVNDILDFSKMGEGRGLILQEVAFDFRKNIEDTVKTLGVRAREKQIDLSVLIKPNVPNRLLGDVGRLRQILINLLGNAVKFTDTGEVFVKVEVNDHSENGVVLLFAVKDTGIGIPKDRQQKIFSSFQQADGTTSRLYGGTGLGLSISTELVSKMEGRIWVDSVYGQGSTFYFTARLKVAPDVDFFPPGLNPKPLAGKRALVAVGNNNHREFIRLCFDEWGVEGVFIRAGNLVLSQHEYYNARQHPFDITLLDTSLEESNRQAYLDGLLAGSVISRQLVLILPVSASAEYTERYSLMGAKRMISKPVTHAELLEVCLRVVKGGKDSRHAFGALPAPVTAATNKEARATHSMRILLVEDNEVNRRVALGILNKRQHQVDVAINGIEAVKRFRQARYDVILMDIQMPKMDGLEATKIIRSSEGDNRERTPIVAMTAHAMNEAKDEAFEAGMDDFISKPLDRQLFIKMVEKFSPESKGKELSEDAMEPKEDPTLRSVNKLQFFNKSVFLDQIGDDPELMVSIIDLYESTTPELMNKLRHALKQMDSDGVHKVCHSIKNSLGPFGAEPAIETMRRLIEVVDKDENFEKARLIAQDLEQDLDGLLEELKVYKENLNPKS